MRCDDCGKPANIRYVEIVDGETRTLHLCDGCANSRGMAISLAPLAAPLVNMLMGLLEEMGADERGSQDGAACPDCGLTVDEFRVGGKLGCSMCYETFTCELKPLLRRVHGSTQHTGSIPSRASADVELSRAARDLQLELERAVHAEEYERAAELRDRIRELEAQRTAGEASGNAGPAGMGPSPGSGGDDVDV